MKTRKFRKTKQCLTIFSVVLVLSCSSERSSSNQSPDNVEIDYAKVFSGTWSLDSDWFVLDNDTIVGDYFGVSFGFKKKGMLNIFVDNLTMDSLTNDFKIQRIERALISYSIKDSFLTIDSCFKGELLFFEITERYKIEMPSPFIINLIPNNSDRNKALVLFNYKLMQEADKHRHNQKVYH